MQNRFIRDYPPEFFDSLNGMITGLVCEPCKYTRPVYQLVGILVFCFSSGFVSVSLLRPILDLGFAWVARFRRRVPVLLGFAYRLRRFPRVDAHVIDLEVARID